MATISSQLNTLATNLQKAHRDGGQFVDAKGSLVGASARAGFRGKVVKLLVDKGLARQGSLGGRLAVALVGRDNFDVLRMSAGELRTKSVANVLALLEKLETEGLDADMKSRVSVKIQSRFDVDTPIKMLNATNLEKLHQALRHQVRLESPACRQDMLAAVGSGQATEGMKRASQFALLLACRGLEEKVDQSNPAGGLNRLVKDETAPVQSRGQGDALGLAQALLDEYAAVDTELRAGLEAEIHLLEEGLAGMKAQAAPRQDLAAQTQAELNRLKQELVQARSALREQFISVMRQTHATKDVEDGAHVRIDGSEGIAVGGKASAVSIGGVEVGEARDTRPTAGDDWAGDFRDALNDAAASGDKEYLLNLAKDLRKVIGSETSSAEDKRAARELSRNEAFLSDFGVLFEALDGGNLFGLDEEAKGLYRPHADRFRQVAQDKFDEMDKIANNPQSSRDYDDYVEVLGSARDAKSAIRAEAKNVRNDAWKLLSALDRLVA